MRVDNEYHQSPASTLDPSDSLSEYGKYLKEADVQDKLQATIVQLGLGEVDPKKFVDILPMLIQTSISDFRRRRGNSLGSGATNEM